MSEIKLLPCPFCGREANVSYNTIHGFVPWCNNEECILNDLTHGYKTESEASKAWNTRKSMERIVERLEKYKSANDMCRENAASAKRNGSVRYFENLIFATEQAISMVKEEGGIE